MKTTYDRMRDEMCDAVRRYCLATRGQLPKSVTLSLWDGTILQEMVPSVPQINPIEPPPETRGGGPIPLLTEGGRRLYWPGLGEFRLSEKQSVVVRVLWDARDEDDPEVSEADLLTAAESDGGRLRDLFRGSRLWKTVVRAGRPKHFRMTDVDGDDELADG